MNKILLMSSTLLLIAIGGCGSSTSKVPIPAGSGGGAPPPTGGTPPATDNQVWPPTSFDCSSDDPLNSSDIDAVPGGHWSGTLVNCTNDTYHPANVLVTEDGYFWMLGPNGQLLSGTLDTFGDALIGTGIDFASAGTDYASGGSTSLWIDGLVAERNSLQGRWGTEWGSYGYFSFAYRDTYHVTPSSLEQLAGVWETWYISSGLEGGAWTIEADGQFRGGDAGGCVHSGQFDVIDDLYNLYAVDLTVTDCDREGIYSGIASREAGDWWPWIITVAVDDGGERALQMNLVY